MCDTPPISIDTVKFSADTDFQNSKYLSAIQIEKNLKTNQQLQGYIRYIKTKVRRKQYHTGTCYNVTMTNWETKLEGYAAFAFV